MRQTKQDLQDEIKELKKRIDFLERQKRILLIMAKEFIDRVKGE